KEDGHFVEGHLDGVDAVGAARLEQGGEIAPQVEPGGIGAEVDLQRLQAGLAAAAPEGQDPLVVALEEEGLNVVGDGDLALESGAAEGVGERAEDDEQLLRLLDQVPAL